MHTFNFNQPSHITQEPSSKILTTRIKNTAIITRHVQCNTYSLDINTNNASNIARHASNTKRNIYHTVHLSWSFHKNHHTIYQSIMIVTTSYVMHTKQHDLLYITHQTYPCPSTTSHHYFSPHTQCKSHIPFQVGYLFLIFPWVYFLHCLQWLSSLIQCTLFTLINLDRAEWWSLILK